MLARAQVEHRGRVVHQEGRRADGGALRRAHLDTAHGGTELVQPLARVRSGAVPELHLERQRVRRRRTTEIPRELPGKPRVVQRGRVGASAVCLVERVRRLFVLPGLEQREALVELLARVGLFRARRLAEQTKHGKHAEDSEQRGPGHTKKSGSSSCPGTLAYWSKSVTPASLKTVSSMQKLPL